MTFNRDIYELANALNSSVLRLQTELLETNRLALALTQKIGNQAFEDQGPQRSELTISIDASPLPKLSKNSCPRYRPALMRQHSRR